MHKVLITLSAAVLILALQPATLADTTIVDLSLGSAMSADFNDGTDWTASDVPGSLPRPDPVSSWAWGAPTSGPGIAASGSNVWATNLAGLYANNECGGLMSPPIDLTGATTASLAFKNWRHFEQSSASGTGWDAGTLMVTTNGGQTFTFIAGNGYTTNTVGTATRTCWDGAPTTQKGWTGPFGTTVPGPTYMTNTSDLTAFAGQTIQVVLAWGSDSTGQRNGWYVDDFAVTIDGVTTTEDFESGNGGFTVVGTKVPPTNIPFGWEHGVPSGTGVGPLSDSPMWATNIDGKYGSNECAWVESPAFTVGPLPNEANAIVTATLSWNQWFRSSSTAGAGVVQIGDGETYTIVAPETGYGASPTSTVLDACLGHLAPALGAFAGLRDAVGSPMTEFRADISAWVGKEITVRYLFASTSSTNTLYEGWYVDDVNVDVRALVSIPDPEDIVPAVGGADAPLWSSGGVASSWAHGVATSGPVGETVYKTNLAGNYNPSECSWIQSPSIPGALLGASATLSFDHWYKMESLTSTSTWDAGLVMVSTDDGATWTYLDLAEYDRPMTTTAIKACTASHGVAPDVLVFSGNNSAAFETVTADLSSLAGANSVTFRFLFGSDSSVHYDGWAIKNVNIAGVKVL